MASGILGILDDIGVIMDDVAVMSKVASKKTAGLLADDLAVNADKASGFVSSRELPVLWKLTKGSFLNKVIILPAAFLLSAFLPIAIVPVLICGGIYLSFEGALKVYEYLGIGSIGDYKEKNSHLLYLFLYALFLFYLAIKCRKLGGGPFYDFDEES